MSGSSVWVKWSLSSHLHATSHVQRRSCNRPTFVRAATVEPLIITNNTNHDQLPPLDSRPSPTAQPFTPSLIEALSYPSIKALASLSPAACYQL